MKILRSYLYLFGVAGLIVALDQWTKHLVRTTIPLGGAWLPAGWEQLAPYGRIVHWYNTGAAFGIFKEGALVFTVLAFLVSGAIIWFFRQVEPGDWFLRLALAMQLGGALGNLIDRLIFGKVTDWISLGNFAVFNVADASISVGTGVMLIGVLILEKREKQAKAQRDPQDGQETEADAGTEVSA